MVRFKGKGLRQKGVLGRKGHLNGTSGPALKEPLGSFSTPTLSLECQEVLLGWGPWGMSASLAYLERFVFYNEQQRRRGEDRRDRPKAALRKRGGRRLVRSGEGGWKSTWDMYAVPKGENQERERGDSRQWLGLLNMAGAPGRSRRGAVVRVCLEADGRMK